MAYTTVKALFTAICDAIRAKTGGTADINHEDIPNEITNLPSGGVSLASYLDRSISGAIVDEAGECTTLGDYALAYCKYITALSLPKATGFVGPQQGYSLFGCNRLELVDLPAITGIGPSSMSYVGTQATDTTFMIESVEGIAVYSFRGTKCTRLNLPNCTSTGEGSCFESSNIQHVRLPRLKSGQTITNLFKNAKVVSLDFGLINTIASTTFTNVTTLKVLALRQSTGVVPLGSVAYIAGSTTAPMRAGTGYVLVPAALVSAYQTATNWATIYAAGTQFLPLEQYTDGTGLLDEDKIDALVNS